MNSSLRNKTIYILCAFLLIGLGPSGNAQDNDLSHESAQMLEVFLSSRVSLSSKIPLHYLGIQGSDSLRPAALDTLDRVLTRDLIVSGLFDLRLPSLPPDTGRSNPFAGRTTYLAGTFSADSTLSAAVGLSMPYGADAFWAHGYEFGDDQARAAGHRIAADVIRMLTGEPTIMQTRIAYLGKMGPGKEIVSASFDGFDQIRHTMHGVPLLSPHWSPDGKRIAYTGFLNDQADIFIFNLEDKTYEPFVTNPGVDQSPAWSPDSKWIAYSSSVDGNPEIYLKSLDNGQVKRLTYSWAIEISPTWSPTGHEIAYVSDQLGRPQVFIMDADGSNQRRLTTEGNYNASPAWSPRGDLIAYVRRDVDGFQIYVTDPRGEEHVKLTTGPGQNMDPCWSPDGLKLAFASNRTGRKQIYTMDLFGRNLTRVSDRSLSCNSPTWSPVLEFDEDIKVTSNINQSKVGK